VIGDKNNPLSLRKGRIFCGMLRFCGALGRLSAELQRGINIDLFYIHNICIFATLLKNRQLALPFIRRHDRSTATAEWCWRSAQPLNNDFFPKLVTMWGNKNNIYKAEYPVSSKICTITIKRVIKK